MITILELDVSIEELGAITASLTRPDARERLGEIVETTELEGVYQEVLGPRSFGEVPMP